MKPIVLAAALLSGFGAFAEEIYTHVAPDGTVRYSNVQPGNRKAASFRARGDLTRVIAPLDFKPKGETTAYDLHIRQACDLYKIPPALVRAIMAAESNFDPFAVSARGAQGLMQLMPETATEMFVDEVFDARKNIFGGVRYLRILANQFEGDMVRIVAAYNAGPEAVKKAGGVPELGETQEYVRRVIRLYFAYKGG
jgi:soluble lytic murein transglycosylase-like protein